MIIKGEAFSVMYETRDPSTNNLVADTGNHTITVYYQSSGTWTSQILCNAQAPDEAPRSDASYPAYIGSANEGIYVFQVPAIYTNCDHVILKISTSTSGIIIPVQQFRPVDLDAISNKVWGRQTGTLVTSDSPRVLTEETNDLIMRLNTINTAAQNSASNAASTVALLGENRYSQPALEIISSTGATSVELNVVRDAHNHISSIN